MKRPYWMECPHCQGWYEESSAKDGYCPLCGLRATSVVGFVVVVVACVEIVYLLARLLDLL
jgi:Zn finger protein HypA/HybF involved in hydrogenase expression